MHFIMYISFAVFWALDGLASDLGYLEQATGEMYVLKFISMAIQVKL